MATNAELVTQLYIGYYDRAPDPVGLQYWIGRLEAGVPLVDIANSFAASPEAQSTYPYFLAPDVLSPNDFLSQVYMNIFGRAIDTGPGSGLEYYGNKLAAGQSPGSVLLEIIQNAVTNTTPGNTDAAFLANKVAAGLDWATEAASNLDKTYQSDGVSLTPAALASAHGVIDGVTADPATVAEAQAETDAFFMSGQTFILTDGDDQIPGLIGSNGTTDNSRDDEIRAGTNNTGGVVGNTLGGADSIDGGTGFDTLKIVDTAAAGASLFPSIMNVERIDVQALAGTTNLDLTNNVAADVQQIWNDRSVSNVNVTNVQGEAAIGTRGSNSRIEVTFAPGVTMGGDMSLFTSGSGVPGNTAEIWINTADAANLTTLNIDSSGTASFLDIDIDNGGGGTAAPTTLNITGNAGLTLREANGQGETNFLTTVNVTSTGAVDLDLSDNDQNIDFNGGNGNTTLLTGDGDSNIMTGDGDDTVRVGDAGSNTGGDNIIDTGAGDDMVFVREGGNDTVMLGAGDDWVDFDDAATSADSADGGEGMDTIEIDVANAAALGPDFSDAISNFEVLYVDDTVNDGEDFTVDLANFDLIDHVITEGTDAGTAVAETQYLSFDDTNQYGGRVTIEGVVIDVPANLSENQVADYIAANFGPQIIAAYNANHPGEVLTAITPDPLFINGHVRFDFSQASGNTPTVAVSNFNGSLTAGTSFGAGSPNTNGTTPVNEVQTLTINTAPTTNGQVVVTLDADAGGARNITVIGGESTIETAQRIANALDALANVSASVDPGTSVVRITYSSTLGDEGLVAFNANGTGSAATATPVQNGQAAAQETQTFEILQGTDGNGGFVRISLSGNTIDVKVDPSLTIDQLGFAIQQQAAAIIAAIPALTSVNYNSANNELSFTANSDIAPIFIGNTPGNFASVYEHNDIFDGVNGGLDGMLTIDNMTSGGTLELAGDNDGITTVNLGSQTAADELNIILRAAIGSNDGTVNVAGIETVNVEQQNATTTNLGLGAADTTTVTVTGVGGVNFTNEFAKLTSFDASGVTGTGAAGSVTVVTNAMTATNLVGGAGDDNITGSNSANDTIDGGAGNDMIMGRGGADNLTGGAGADMFTYAAVTDSQGVTVDNIVDFMSGSDTIDLRGLTQGGAASYLGEANGYGAVLTSLTADGSSHAVLDTSTSTLYVDINGDGSLDNNDMAINLTGITDLTNNGTHNDVLFY